MLPGAVNGPTLWQTLLRWGEVPLWIKLTLVGYHTIVVVVVVVRHVI
jgi:hypothetical protein